MAAVSTTEQVTTMVAQAGGLAILAGTLAAIVAFLYRWSIRESVPSGLSMLVGLSAVAIYLNTTSTLAGVVSGGPSNVEEALFNIAAFAVAGGGAVVGRRVGDRFGSEVFVDGGVDARKDVGQFVRSVGRVVAIDLPEDIDDVVGYDPVPEQTKEDLAGRRFLFPRNLTVEELRERLVSRLKTDYGVGHVDVELAADGRVEHLAVGSRAAGIGPTLPPATNAVAIRADPAHAASAGDLVQVWETNPMRRVLTAELRGVADDTVTIAIDAADTPKLDPREEYRLVTLPVTDRPDREFAALLRAAEETFSSVTVEAGSPLHGMPVGSLDIAVVSVQPESGDPVTLPDTTHVLAPGDTVFVVARPTELRRLETAAEPLDPSLVKDIGKPRMPSEQSGTPAAEEPASPESPGAGEPAPTANAPPGEEPSAEGVGPADSADTPDSPTGAGEESPQGVEAGASEEIPESDGSEEVTPSAEEADDDSATADSDEPDDSGAEEESEIDGKAGTGSFAQLKDEFESDEAEWAESDAESSDDAASDEADTEAASTDDLTDLSPGEEDSEPSRESEAGADESQTDDGLDDLGIGGESGEGLDDLEIAEESDGSEEGGLEADDELDDLGIEEGTDDDLSALSFDEEETDDLSFEGDDDAETDGGNNGDSDDEDDDDDDDDEDDDDDGGGSFAQLKEEFESGEADWADDIGSPGGDMRLDE